MYTGSNYDIAFQQLWKWARPVQAPQPAPPALLAPSVTRKRRRAFVTMRTASWLRGPRAVSSTDKLNVQAVRSAYFAGHCAGVIQLHSDH